MIVEFAPHANEPDIRFRFDLNDIALFIREQLARLESAPQALSPHKQIKRDWHQQQIEPLLTAQRKIQQWLAQPPETLSWAEVAFGRPNMLLADLLEAGIGYATCPVCQNVYAADELDVYEEVSSVSGRLITCPQNHPLVQTWERFGVATEPMPYKRTLRRCGVADAPA